MIEAAGQAWVGKFGETPKIKENEKSAVGIHSVSCDTTVYVPGRVGGQLVAIVNWAWLVNQWCLLMPNH